MTKPLLDIPSYYEKLYHSLLDTFDADINWKPDKINRDILLTLLIYSQPNIKRKVLRKQVRSDVHEIIMRHFKILFPT